MMGLMTYLNPSKRFSEKDFMIKMPDGSWEQVEKLFREGHGDEISQVICTMVPSKSSRSTTSRLFTWPSKP